MEPAVTFDGSLNQEAKAKLQAGMDVTAAVPGDESPKASDQEDLVVSYPPPSSAEDPNLVSHLVTFVNAIYLVAEGPFWADGFVRTNLDEVRTLIRSESLALAWRSSSPQTDPADIIGCICVKRQTGEFGMLCCDPDARGTGVGRMLLRFAEDDVRAHGGKEIRLEVLQGKGWTHELKARLAAWYVRNGFVLEKVKEVGEHLPELVRLMVKPAVVWCYRKAL